MATTLHMHAPHAHAHRRRYVVGGILLFIAALLIAARLYLNSWLFDYVNHVLRDTIPGYTGSVEDIDIHLYRGAYSAHGLKVFKKRGNISVPFIDIDTVDLSIEWKALLHGRIVSDAHLLKPELNFAVNRSGTVEQTGTEVDWMKPIKDLMPIDIDIVTFKDGTLTYQDFSKTPKVNIFIHHMEGEAHNLRNVVDKSKALPSTLYVKGDSIGGGKLEIKGNLNILNPPPDMDLDIKLEKVDLKALSNYTNAYAAVDIKEGNLSVYSEVTVKNGEVSGYVKPLATNVHLIDLTKPTNPVKLAWEAVVATVVKIFTNHPKDQFATKVELEGNIRNINTDTWSAVGGIIRNAFVKALQQGIDNDVGFDKAP